MSQAIEFFSEHLASQEISKRLQELEPSLPLEWEAATVSVLSPGPVGNGETLCRQLFDPLSFDFEKQEPTPTAFDDLNNKGLSVDRVEVAGREVIVSLGQAKAAADNVKPTTTRPRQLIGLCELKCGWLREFVGATGQRILAVYDTAMEGRTSHADACQIVKDKKEFRSARARLWEHAKSNWKSVEEFKK